MSNTEVFSTMALSELTDAAEVGFENPREKLPDIKTLAAQIRDAEGEGKPALKNVIQVWVTEKDSKEVKILIGGHRRKAAIEMLAEEGTSKGLEKRVPVRYDYVSKTLTDARYAALHDNIDRAELTSFELTQAMYRLHESGESGKTIAARLKTSETAVSRRLSAFKAASSALKKAWRDNKLSDDNVQDVAKLPEEEQEAAVESLIKLRDEGRAGKSKARKKAKDKAGKTTRPSSKVLQEMVVMSEDAPEKLDYVQGVRDALRFAMGSMPLGRFKPEWKEWVKAAEKAAEAKVAADAEKAKEKLAGKKAAKKAKNGHAASASA